MCLIGIWMENPASYLRLKIHLSTAVFSCFHLPISNRSDGGKNMKQAPSFRGDFHL